MWTCTCDVCVCVHVVYFNIVFVHGKCLVEYSISVRLHCTGLPLLLECAHSRRDVQVYVRVSLADEGTSLLHRCVHWMHHHCTHICDVLFKMQCLLIK